MTDKKETILTIFNRNLSENQHYTKDEIILAFSKQYSSGTEREKSLYKKYFKECTNDKYVDELKNDYKISTQKIKKLYRFLSNEMKIEFGTYWSTRFKLPKVIGIISSRDAIEYTNIDNFQIYELTPCIAYEMAMRNTKVKMLFKRYELITDMSHDNNKRFFSRDAFKKAKLNEELSIEYENCTYEEYEVVIMRKLNTYKQLIEKDYKKFIDEHIDKCTELTINELTLLKEKLVTELINDYLIYPKGYQRKVDGVKYWYQEEITNSKKAKGKYIIDADMESDGWQIRFEEIVSDTFIQVQGVHIQDGEYFVNNIIPNFHRQMNDQNQINIPINFSLPLEEITDYIAKVKNKINPKTPLELLGQELKKAENLKNMTVKKESKGKMEIFDGTKGENAPTKFADLFYVYDMKKRGIDNIDIIYELDKFHIDKKTTISTNTIKKYVSIAEEYIENEKYKELITGKKVND